MVDYTKIHLLYWSFFFQDELANDPTNETLQKISQTLSNSHEFGIISIISHFISIYAKQFIQDTDFFQRQNKPVFPFVEGHLYHLSAFLESNCNSSNFGLEIETTITSCTVILIHMNFILFLDQLLEKLKTNLMLIFLYILHVLFFKLLKFLILNIFYLVLWKEKIWIIIVLLEN